MNIETVITITLDNGQKIQLTKNQADQLYLKLGAELNNTKIIPSIFTDTSIPPVFGEPFRYHTAANNPLTNP